MNNANSKVTEVDAYDWRASELPTDVQLQRALVLFVDQYTRPERDALNVAEDKARRTVKGRKTRYVEHAEQRLESARHAAVSMFREHVSGRFDLV